MQDEYGWNTVWGRLKASPLGDRAIVLSAAFEPEGRPWEALARLAYAMRMRKPLWLEDVVPAYDTVTLYYHPYTLHRHAAVLRSGREDGDRVNGRISGAGSSAEDRGKELLVQASVSSYAAGGKYASPDGGMSAGMAERPYDLVAQWIGQLLGDWADQEEGEASRLVLIPVCYGGAEGPDLEEAAQRAGLSAADYVELHSSTDYTVAMMGFMPGFPYLVGLPPQLAQPRRSEPRTRVPAGSVAVAAEQTGIYPVDAPGGWQLIGRTPLKLFDALAEDPALLRTGDRVRFVPISPEQRAGAEGAWGG